MKLATAQRLEAEAKAKPNGIHVIRDPEGAVVALVAPNTFSMILVEADENLEAHITRAQARFTADMGA